MIITNTALRALLVIYELVKANPRPSPQPEKNGDIGGQKPMRGIENYPGMRGPDHERDLLLR